MEDSSREIEYLDLDQVVSINRRMITDFGGLFLGHDNLLNKTALEYVIEAVQTSLYGIEIYPSLKEKACALSHHIISRHVFNDGNKRTAANVALEFLESNGITLKIDESIVDLTLDIADGKVNEQGLLDWLHSHQ